MRKANLTVQAAPVVTAGGCDGGGWVTGIRVRASNGNLVSRNDTGTANFRLGTDTQWTQAYRVGDNVSISDYVFKNPVAEVYDIDLAQTDNTVCMAAYGYLYLSTDFCTTFAKLTTFKSGTFDATFGFTSDANARIGGCHVRIDPVNSSRIAVGHPVDGGYITLDKGVTAFAIPASLPAPINSGSERRGVHWAFDADSASGGSCQKVYCFIEGRGCYYSSTGLGGTFSLLASGPTHCTSIHAAGGKVYVCGDGYSNDSQLFVWSGSAWVQPSGIVGMALTSKPGDSTKVMMMRVGGGQVYSADTGVTWTDYEIATSINAADVPWLAATNTAYLSIGACAWEARSGVNRLHISCGVGTFYTDNPPRTTNTPYVSTTLGIKQMLLKNGTMTPKGTLFLCGEDRAFWRFGRGKITIQATGHGPNYDNPIRHGTDIDWCGSDENYVVGVQLGQNPATDLQTCWISTDNGKTWGASPTIPNSTFAGGNVAVSGVGKFTWCSEGTNAAGSIRTTLDGGATWINPVFGASVDMSTACWHDAYYLRRKILVADKSTPGRILAYCCGNAARDNSAQDQAMRGLWESLDYGQTFTRIRSSYFVSGGNDFYQCKLRLVPGFANHLFWATGNVNNYPTPPAPDGLYFSTNKGTTTTTMAGFSEVEDVTFTPRPPGTSRAYPRINVKGFRSTTYGTWASDDFDYTNPTAATWTLLTGGPEGRQDGDMSLVGDMNSYPGLTLVMSSGGFYVFEDPVKLRAV